MGHGMRRQGLMLYFMASVLLLAAMVSANANAAFITDKIMVEVRTERFGQGTVLKKLPSGTSVEVLMTDGQYTRIRTPNNITGWVASTFITKEKPTQLEYLELLSKSKATETRLRAAEQQLANAGTDGSTASISEAEIEQLKQQAKDARWMKVEMQKARDRANQAEAKLKSKNKKSGDAQQELDTLRTQNKDLEQRLAAAILVNEQQSQEISQESSSEETAAITTVTSTAMPPGEDEGWRVGVNWFLGCLIVALIAGFIAGILWLDKRIRQRHGGFRIY
jgi:SH3 domain protein